MGVDARFSLFVVWATGHWTFGETVIVFLFSVYRSLSFLVSVLLCHESSVHPLHIS